jgi:Fe-S-cluster containining protein
MGCKKCGTCCRWVYISSTDGHKLYVDTLMSFRGIELVDDYIIRIPAPCQYLDQETNRCNIYDNRPQYCQDFPEIGVRPKECKYVD